MNSGTEIATLTEALLACYGANGASPRPSRPLPAKDVVTGIVETLRRVIFPGYFGEGDVPDDDFGHYVAGLLIDVRRNLQEQIGRALSHAGSPDPGARAKEMTSAFLAELPRLRAILLTDVEAAFDGDPAATGTHEVVFAYPGLFAITAYRIAHVLHGLAAPLIPRIMTEYAHGLTGIDIHPGASIGSHFFIDHGTGVVIGETTVIGDRVKIYQGVTLGALSTRGGQSLRGKRRHPTLEDEVTVYSSASILGGESVIGKGAVIGANAFITSSVPPGARVSGPV